MKTKIFDLKEYRNSARIKIVIENTDDEYKMMHKAPGKEDGVPIYDMTHNGGYPPDIYSYDGARYYGDNGGDWNDRDCIAIIRELHNKPNKLVKIYRAVPDINFEIVQKIKPLKYLVDYNDKWGFFPIKGDKKIIYDLEDKYDAQGVEGYDNVREKVIQDLCDQIQELENQKKKPIGINDGDWVTINLDYAKEHGKSNLGGKFKIVSKTVKASQLYSECNSIYEYGYNV